nr:transposase [Pseudoalteromonas sp. JB197]
MFLAFLCSKQSETNKLLLRTSLRVELNTEWYGRTVVKIDKWYPSSKRCNCCGYVVDPLPLHIRKWSCPQCSSELDRDINAALNIKAVGQTVLACGA